MSEALPFAEIKLALLQGFLARLRSVMSWHGAEHFIWPSRSVSFYASPTLCIVRTSPLGTNDTMFDVAGTSAREKRSSACVGTRLSICRVDHFTKHRQIDRPLLRTQSINPVDSSDQTTAISR